MDYIQCKTCNKKLNECTCGSEEQLENIASFLMSKEWVELTDEETIDLLPAGEWDIEATLFFAQRISEKLREKNSGIN
jgi:hypothetical protein